MKSEGFLKVIHETGLPTILATAESSFIWKLSEAFVATLEASTIILEEMRSKIAPSDDRKPAIAADFSIDAALAGVECLLTSAEFPLVSFFEKLLGMQEYLDYIQEVNSYMSLNASDHPSLEEVLQIFCLTLAKRTGSVYYSGNSILRNISNNYLYLKTAPCIPDNELQILEIMLLSNDSITTADRIYICQLQIHENRQKDAIPVLEHVVSEELVNPLSLVIWHKTLGTFLDDNVKSELHQSSICCIVVPSVVYALYLLANVYSSLGDKDAYEGTMKRFEQVLDFFEDDSPTSKVLFTCVMSLR